MPLYVFDCRDCGPFELLLPLLPASETADCPNCGAPSPLVPSLCAMMPDSLWAGVVDKDYGYLTSRTDLKAEMRQHGHVEIHGRDDLEAVRKTAEKAAAAKEQASRQAIRKWAEKTFGPSGLGLGGADGAKLIKENT